MDESARTRRQLDFRTHANEAFEDRSSFLLERASRPEDFNK